MREEDKSIETVIQEHENYLYRYVKDEDKAAVSAFLEAEEERIDDPCVDNYRIYPEDKSDEYDEQANTGCCGFHDTEFTGPSGTVYLVGFNYGH